MDSPAPPAPDAAVARPDLPESLTLNQRWFRFVPGRCPAYVQVWPRVPSDN